VSGEAADVRVRVLQLGRRVMQHSGPAGLTLAEALNGVGLSAQQLEGMDLRVNGTTAEPTTVLRDRDTVTIIPRIKGG
jgi:sulfur carrier protein ThiS